MRDDREIIDRINAERQAEIRAERRRVLLAVVALWLIALVLLAGAVSLIVGAGQ